MSTLKFNSANEAFIYLAKDIYNNPSFDVSPRGQRTKENLGVAIEIINPYARYVTNKHRNFSLGYAVGEWLWYERASDRLEEISYYSKFWNKVSDNGETVNSAYGYRIFGKHPSIPVNQWQFAKQELLRDPSSRRAVCIIASPIDMEKDTKDFPCTVYLQFFIRDSKLYMSANMRSNDLILGFANDVVAFTLFQEKMLVELRKVIPHLGMGSYYHYASSLHIYERNFSLVEAAIAEPDENINVSLPEMKELDEIKKLQANEETIRKKLKRPLLPLTDDFCKVCQDLLIEYAR